MGRELVRPCNRVALEGCNENVRLGEFEMSDRGMGVDGSFEGGGVCSSRARLACWFCIRSSADGPDNLLSGTKALGPKTCLKSALPVRSQRIDTITYISHHFRSSKP